MNKAYVLIMAGGEGTRFAPLSTPERPKQFLNFLGSGTFIQQTARRVSSAVPPERVYVATNKRYEKLVREQLAEVPAANIILETAKKNTAPCIAYAARLIYERDPEAVIVVLPCDHSIQREKRFLEVIGKGVELCAAEKRIVTIGIKPTWPATCYGYIRAASKVSKERDGFCDVEAFVEKPDEDTARIFLSDGRHYWNSGMFVFSARTIMEEIAEYLKGLHGELEGFENGDAFRDRFFEAVDSISIDYGIMEKSKRISVIPADLGWSDVGTWEGLYRLHRDEEIAVSPTVLQTMREQLGYVASEENKIPRKVEKPWGHEEIWAHSPDYVGKILAIERGKRLSFQYHRIKEETIMVVDGVVEIEVEELGKSRTVRMKKGDVIHIAPGTRHRMMAVESCRLVEVSTPYLEDCVRIEDDYGRAE